MNELHSDGLHVRNPRQPAPQQTFVVVGLHRGGTTMAAKVLSALGVVMVNRGTIATEEDPEFVHLLSPAFRDEATVDAQAFERLARRRDASHPLWGFKVPGFVFPHLYPRLRNPRLVVICRDPVAVAKREAVSTDTAIEPHLRAAVGRQRLMVEYGAATDLPVLLASYEKVIAEPQAFVRLLAGWIGTEDPGRIGAALATIQCSPPEYVRRTARR